MSATYCINKRPANRRRHLPERVALQGLRVATYVIILAVTGILLTIFYQGSSVLFQTKYPFINTEFLTSSPETLHVYKPRDITEALVEKHILRVQLEQKLTPFAGATAEELQQVKANLSTLYAEIDLLEKQSTAGEIRLGDSVFRAISEKPTLEKYTYENYAYSAGGIGPAIIGTTLLVLGSIAIAMLLGIPCAIYLSEYSKQGRMLRLIRLAVLNLAGVPSIVFGLFGFGIFVLFFGWGISLLAGWFTLAIMALPIVIAASEQALRAVPNSFREGSYALGASKWTVIKTNVLPHALPGILTSSILSIARVAGETAPIMFTAAYALRDQLPWQDLENTSEFFFQGVMALPYHIYIVSSKLPQNDYTREMQYGSVFVFLFLVGSLASGSILLRARIIKRRMW